MTKSIIHVPWTDAHLRTLREEFPKGIQFAMEALPDHSECAIRTRASNMGIKLSREAMLESRAPNERKLIALLRANPGMKMAAIAESTGRTKASLHSRMTQMKKRGLIYCEGVNSQTVWFAEKEAAKFELPPEYIKVPSIFRVGERVASMLGVLA